MFLHFSALITARYYLDMTEYPNTKLIPLTQGKFAIVDEEDYTKVIIYNWKLLRLSHRLEYVRASHKGKKIYLHRLIMGFPENKCIDHKNHNGLDNRKENLRKCTRAENNMNIPKRKESKSKFKGIFWHPKANKWCAQISINNKMCHIGLFNKEEDAAMAYDEKARIFYGEFACTNFSNPSIAYEDYRSKKPQTPIPNSVL